jgi:type I restriction enzyme, S subunit
MRPGYKQTEIGVIPESWDVIEIKSVVPAGKKYGIVDGPFGSNLKSIHYRKSGIPIITSGYVTEGRFLPKDYLFVDEEKFRQEKRSAVHGGDIVMAKIGARCGTSAILPPEQQTSILSGNAMKISVDQERHSTYYIWQVLWDMYLKGATDEIKTVGAQPAISMASLKKYRIAAPPKEEQEAIAAALSDADGLLAGLDRLIAKKRAVKTAVMQQLLTGEVRVGEGGDGRWETKFIGEFTDCTAGGTPSTLVEAYWGGNIKWMSSGELHLKFVDDVEGRITEEGLKSSSTKILPPNCVLIGLAGQGKTRGTVAMNTVELCTNQSIAAIFPNNSFEPKFLYYYLDTQYENLRTMSAGDGGRGGLNLTIIRNISVPFPSKEEQRAIAAILSDIDAEIAALEARRAKTAAIKQGMMQELLTGRTRLA